MNISPYVFQCFKKLACCTIVLYALVFRLLSEKKVRPQTITVKKRVSPGAPRLMNFCQDDRSAECSKDESDIDIHTDVFAFVFVQFELYIPQNANPLYWSRQIVLSTLTY